MDIKQRPLKDVYPAAWFADLVEFHKDAFFVGLESMQRQQNAGLWRLLDQLPSLADDDFGDPMSSDDFRRVHGADHKKYFKNLFNILENCVMVLEGEWHDIEWRYML